jgi:putative PIN family toxin of toxin-antitoxin system
VIRAVVDPSVFVSAFIGNPDAGPGQLVDAWRDRRFVLVVSPLLLAELGEVLSRPKFARWAGDGRAEAYVAGFSARSEHQPDPSQPPPQAVRDPKDDYLVALIHATQADVLVSLDRDLLDAQLDGITVTDPAVFVGSLEDANDK